MLNLRKSLLVWLAAILLPVFCFAQNSAADNDELLNILQEQVKLQCAKYNQPNIPVYRLALEVEETSKQVLTVSSGSPYRDDEPKLKRALTVVCVLGTEDYHYTGLCHEYGVLPMYNDKAIIEKKINLLAQRAYQCALDLYLELEDSTKLVSEDYYSEHEFHKDTFYYELPEKDNSYDHWAVLEKLEDVTEFGSRQQDVSECFVTMNYEKKRTYYVSNENATVVSNEITTNAFLKLCTGERCLEQNYLVEHPDDLPAVETMFTDISMMYDSLAKFPNHPVKYPKLTKPAPIEKGFGDSEYSTVAFQAMQDEMDANLSELRYSGQYPPYAIRYVIADAQPFRVTSSFGCVTEICRDRKRLIAAEVNVGNDIFNDKHYYWDKMATSSAPLDNSYAVLRAALRETTFEEYMRSVENFKSKCRHLKKEHLEMGSLLPDRLEADKVDPNKYAVAAPMSMEPVDIHAMQNLTDELSSLSNKCKYADLLSVFDVDIYGFQGNAYLLASDGTRLVQPFSQITIQLSGQWGDGQGCASRDRTFTSFDQFPDISVLKQWTCDFLDYLVELRDAPEFEEIYDGPVLFEGSAAAQLFAEAAFWLRAERQPIDNDGYSYFSYESQLDKRIFSPIVDVTAVDTVSGFDGVRFIGTYDVDADGVAPIPDLELVRRGELITLLANREPSQAKLMSNGHHRVLANFVSEECAHNTLGLRCAPGVTRLTSHRRLSKEKIEKQLRQLARADGYRYAYIVSDNDYPMTVYRVDVNTGKRQLVKYLGWGGEGSFSLINLEATSNHDIGYNAMVYVPETAPTSVIVPDGLLFRRYHLVPLVVPFVEY